MKRLVLILILFIAVSFALRAQQEIKTDTVLSFSTCSGQDIMVFYSSSGGSFNQGNRFQVEMSNFWGNFSNPTVIGEISFNLGIILAKIPADASPGLYRIRVVSTNPPVIGSNAPNPIFITNFPNAASISTSSADTLCFGETATLSVNNAEAYLWSTGETTQSINVTTDGNYWVKTTDLGGCDDRDTLKVNFKECSTVGIEDVVKIIPGVSVYPNPAREKITISHHYQENVRVEITDITGKVVLQDVAFEKTEIDISSLKNGMYFLRAFISENGTASTKVFKIIKL